jgi:hypothetical protein
VYQLGGITRHTWHIVWVATEVLVIRVALKLQNNTLIREVF